MDLKRKILPNGLDIIYVHQKNVPIISLNLAYRVGSKDEKAGKSGFAHLFEHLMFEGTKTIAKGEFDRLCSIAGGTNNAYTTYDLTSYNMTLPANQLELGLWLESDRMFNFEVTDKAFINQKSVVTEEIRQTVFNQPYAQWRELLARNAYDSRCSYSWEVHGNIDDIEKSSLHDAEEFCNKYYTPGNACLVLCGDLQYDTADAMIDKYFNQVTHTGIIKRNTFKESYKKQGMHASYLDSVPLAGVFLSYHCRGFISDETFAADILANIIGEGRSSLLYRELVYEEQIASSVGAYVDKREDSSLITLYAIANSPKTTADELYNSIIDSLHQLKGGFLDSKEFEKSRNQLSTQLAYEMQYSSGVADLIAQQAIFWNDPERLFSLMDHYRSVTQDHIEDFINKYLDPANAVRIDVLPNGASLS